MGKIALLPDRAVLEVTGADRVGFLQGLVSNDVALAGPGRAVWAALLTPQGKWLADFFIVAGAAEGEGAGERLLLDVEAGQAAMLVQRLSRYRLRAQVAVGLTALGVQAGWDGAAMPEDGWADPRLAAAGWRRIGAGLGASLGAGDATAAAYDLHRLVLGLPDGSRDMEAEKTTLLEAGFDALHGVSWTKGCYMGQELTARTKYRGLLKRRLVGVAVEGALPAAGTPVFREGVEVGVLRSGRSGRALALLRNEVGGEGELACGGAVLRVVMEVGGGIADAAPV